MSWQFLLLFLSHTAGNWRASTLENCHFCSVHSSQKMTPPTHLYLTKLIQSYKDIYFSCSWNTDILKSTLFLVRHGSSHYILILIIFSPSFLFSPLISDRKRTGTKADMWILWLGRLRLHFQRLQKILLCGLCQKASGRTLPTKFGFVGDWILNVLFWTGTMWVAQKGWAFSIQKRTSKWIIGAENLRAVSA